MTPTPTIRERILQQLQLMFESQVAGQPERDPYFIEWSLVQRAPMSDRDVGKKHVLVILDQNELDTEITNQIEAKLQVFLEYESSVDNGVLAATHSNTVLGEIKRLIGHNRQIIETSTGIQLAYFMRYTNTSIEVESFSTRRVSGTVQLVIDYRHDVRDPRKFINRRF